MLKLLDSKPSSRMPGGATWLWALVISALVMAGAALPMVMSSDTADPVDSAAPAEVAQFAAAEEAVTRAEAASGAVEVEAASGAVEVKEALKTTSTQQLPAKSPPKTLLPPPPSPRPHQAPPPSPETLLEKQKRLEKEAELLEQQRQNLQQEHEQLKQAAESIRQRQRNLITALQVDLCTMRTIMLELLGRVSYDPSYSFLVEHYEKMKARLHSIAVHLGGCPELINLLPVNPGYSSINFNLLPEAAASSAGAPPASAPSKTATEDLYNAAEMGDHEALLKALKDGANVDHVDVATTKTALHWASLCGRPEDMKALLKAGASVDVMTKSGVTPLIFAASQGWDDCVPLLLEGGANKALDLGGNLNERYTALYYAKNKGKLKNVYPREDDCVSLLLNKALETNKGWTAVAAAKEKVGKGRYVNVIKQLSDDSVQLCLLCKDVHLCDHFCS